tara:strand:- start:8928 stop:9833 length:906 start_codon:yes stop_codon:yes gene_type:complete
MLKYFSKDQIEYWYRKYIPEKIRDFIRDSIPFWIQLRYFSIQAKKFDLEKQGHGEAKKLLELCEKFEINNGYYVDIGASDGWTSSATFPFAKSNNFSGLSIEPDSLKFKKMNFIYKNFNNTHLSDSKVTPENITSLLKEFDVPENFDLLNLDIDSYDLFVVKALLNSFQPKIISMEINEKIPPPIYFTVTYDEKHVYEGDDFYGCSLQAAYEELCKFDYKLHTLLYNNAIFISSEVSTNQQKLSITEFYINGYVDKPDRTQKFSYNKDKDVLLDMDKNSAVDFINDLYKNYAGKYLIELRD